MTVSSENNFTHQVGVSTQDTYIYDFLLLDESHMVVYIDGVLTVNSYTVTGVGNSTGGSIIFDSVNPPDNSTVTMSRAVPATQLIDYKAYDAFPAETHEGGLDKLTLLVQEAMALAFRGLHFPIDESTSGALADIATRADKYLAFDDQGDLIYLDGTTADPLTVKQQGNITPGNVTQWAGQSLVEDGGVATSDLYSTSNPPPDTSANKIDKVSTPTLGNAVTVTTAGNLNDAGFPLIGLEINTVTVSNWSRNTHTGSSHGLASRPLFVQCVAVITAAISPGNWAVGDRVAVGFGYSGDANNNAALGVTMGDSNFTVRHSSAVTGQHIAIPWKTNTSAQTDIIWLAQSDADLEFTFFGVGA